MHILVADPLSEAGLRYLQEQHGFKVDYRPESSVPELLAEIGQADGLIVRSKTKVTPAVLDAAPKLRVIGRAGAGVDNIDVKAATQRGVLVMNTPGVNSVSAAEHAFTLLLALARRIPLVDAALRRGNWRKTGLIGQELGGKQLGIVGLGQIGSLVAQRALGFQMKVLAFDPFVGDKYAADLGVELLSLEDLLRQSDFVSLHLPLNEKSKGLICRRTLKLMKKGAFLVNAARGALVVEEDLADSLEAGHLGGAGLDVFQAEPQVNPRLLASDRTVLTPHIAGSTVEAQAKVGLDIAVQISDYLLHEVISHAINFPSISNQELAQILPYAKLGEKLGSFISQIAQLRVSEIGIRYYGDWTNLNYKPVTNYILKALLQPILSEEVNEVNAHARAKERGISVEESLSGRKRAYSNLISIQLRSSDQVEWVEGALLHQGSPRLVSVDGIPVETHLGEHILFFRNRDKPGVIGLLGTILGREKINIASFVLGRGEEHPYAVGVLNTDSQIPEKVSDEIRAIAALQFARVVRL